MSASKNTQINTAFKVESCITTDNSLISAILSCHLLLYCIKVYFAHKQRLVLGSRARMVRNEEGQQLKCAKQLHRGLGAQNGNFYVTYFLTNHNRNFVYYLTYF